MKIVNVNIGQMQIFVIINNVGDKGFIWNPGNCECQSVKSCDVGEYLNY